MDGTIGPIRPRRRRQSAAIRGLVRETRVTPERLVLPLFVREGEGVDEPIGAIPGHSRLSVDLAVRRCGEAAGLGVRAVCLFPVVPGEKKTPDAAEGLREDNVLVRAVGAIKRELPELLVVTDVALDPYNSDGHDGLVGPASSGGGAGPIENRPHRVLNDETVELLAQMAVLHARAGADAVGPSDMMDGRVGAIRSALDSAGLTDTLIISYTAKYASAFYGPFRRALDSAPAGGEGVPGDKRTYQMDPANGREALIEAGLDEREGADVLMVKPGLPYVDVIARLRGASSLPIAAYHVSGEYAMLKAAAARGWVDEEACLAESITCLGRAGADVIFTYGALEYARMFREGRVEG